MATLGPGAILGEMGPLVNTPRTATAITSAESHLWRISTSVFHDALQRGETWATRFLHNLPQMLGRRVMGMNEELVVMLRLHQNSAQPKSGKPLPRSNSCGKTDHGVDVLTDQRGGDSKLIAKVNTPTPAPSWPDYK